MDTDSFVISIFASDVIEDLNKLKYLFSFSKLNEDHELFSDKNKNVVGNFKIETNLIF